MTPLEFLRLAILLVLLFLGGGVLAAVLISDGLIKHFDRTCKALLVPLALLFVLVVYGLTI